MTIDDITHPLYPTYRIAIQSWMASVPAPTFQEWLRSNDSQPKMMGGIFGETKTLRDEFAMAALAGYRAAYHQWYAQVGATGKFAEPAEMARWAYADADAMMKERNRT